MEIKPSWLSSLANIVRIMRVPFWLQAAVFPVGSAALYILIMASYWHAAGFSTHPLPTWLGFAVTCLGLPLWLGILSSGPHWRKRISERRFGWVPFTVYAIFLYVFTISNTWTWAYASGYAAAEMAPQVGGSGESIMVEWLWIDLQTLIALVIYTATYVRRYMRATSMMPSSPTDVTIIASRRSVRWIASEAITITIAYYLVMGLVFWRLGEQGGWFHHVFSWSTFMITCGALPYWYSGLAMRIRRDSRINLKRAVTALSVGLVVCAFLNGIVAGMASGSWRAIFHQTSLYPQNTIGLLVMQGITAVVQAAIAVGVFRMSCKLRLFPIRHETNG